MGRCSRVPGFGVITIFSICYAPDGRCIAYARGLYTYLKMVRNGMVSHPCRYVTFYGHLRYVITYRDSQRYA